MKKFVQSYGIPNDNKAYIALGITVIVEIAAILLIHANLGLLGWMIHTLNCVRIFVQFHDMAHFSFFSDMSKNILVGKIFGVYAHFPFNAWRDGHNHHHKHFGNLDRFDASQTILFTKKQFEAMSLPKKILVRIFREPIVFFLFSAPYVWFVGLFYTVAKRYGVFSWTFLEKIISVVLYTWIFPLFGIPAWKMWVSIIAAEIIGTILFHLQHSVNTPYRQRQTNWDFAKAAVEGSTYL